MTLTKEEFIQQYILNYIRSGSEKKGIVLLIIEATKAYNEIKEECQK